MRFTSIINYKEKFNYIRRLKLKMTSYIVEIKINPSHIFEYIVKWNEMK